MCTYTRIHCSLSKRWCGAHARKVPIVEHVMSQCVYVMLTDRFTRAVYICMYIYKNTLQDLKNGRVPPMLANPPVVCVYNTNRYIYTCNIHVCVHLNECAIVVANGPVPPKLLK